MREIRFKFKLARKTCNTGACIDLMVKRWKRFEIPIYWRITLYYGGYACPYDEDDYIKCINHEVMHAILDEMGGEDANAGWDNIVKSECDENYGWKNIVGKYLSDIYCDEGE